jgi:putative pyruvate formate lyase activating enzyme
VGDLLADRETRGRRLLSRAVDPRFVLDEFEPAYQGLSTQALEDKVRQARAELAACRACPRDCDVDRTADELGTCNTGRYPIVSSAFAHFGEEDCLRGWHGSGSIFFGLCNLRCVFCQNWDISQEHTGRECTEEELAALMLRLQDEGCHNVNLVTPEHVVPQVVEAIVLAAGEGLALPIVYNTSAYDALGSLRLLEGLVDVYMPDFKFWEPSTAGRLARARDYPERAREAIAEMHRQVGVLSFGADGLARRGVLVRHLVMPAQQRETAAIFEWLAETLSEDTYVNVMGQYRPDHQVRSSDRYADIDRRPDTAEMNAAFSAARAAGLWRLDDRVLPW